MKAVILAGGASLAQYNESDFTDAFVIAVNATILKLDKGAKVDLVMAQDKLSTARKNNPAFFTIDKSIPLQFVADHGWDAYAKERGNATVMPSRVHTFSKWKVGGDICAHGNTTAISAILEALRRGYTEVYVFGHDCSAGHALHNDGLIHKTIKELNFAHSVAKDKGGAVYLASSSYLWQYNSVDSPAIELESYEPVSIEQVTEEIKKPTKRRLKK